jgi:hypothetical protein
VKGISGVDRCEWRAWLEIGIVRPGLRIHSLSMVADLPRDALVQVAR